ncbi:tetratricopeptide repeat protein [Flavobacteriaceae bacterium F89]|uniref:histidine kinase n=1 Tax=Cerina litoralis TaxID=2874477 RepID=A0AAE3JTG7_9FLAO|nr:tetratricopeptide repeat protein [Cerina litoralis]MCG2461507.1 tetratricopeptide repeat protein [Cerina litoralis]
MKKLSLLLSFLLCGSLYSQSRLDSLLPLVHTLPEDSTKVQAYLDIAWDLLRKDSKTSLIYADSAGNLSKKLNLATRLAHSKMTKSFALSGMGNYREAESSLAGALDLFNRFNDREMILDTKVEFGWLKQMQSQFDSATIYFMAALPMAEKLGDKNNEARIHNYLGGIYKAQKQYDKAIDHYKIALDLVEDLGIKVGISACLANLADAYTKIGKFDKAIAFSERAIKLKKELDDDLGAGRVLNNLGIIYNELGYFGKAEHSFQKALEMANRVGNQKLISSIRVGLMTAAYGKKEYERSIEMGKNLLATTDSLADLEIQFNVRRQLSRAYGELGQFKNAYKNALLSLIISDSLYNEKILSTTNTLEAKYQNEQKAKEIALLSSEKDLQQFQLQKRVNERNVIIVLALLAVIIAGLLYNQYHIKQRSNRDLRELDKLKSNFFANISHEFRTPLTLIKGPIEEYEQNPEEPLSLDNARMIRRNANRVLGLVDQLLDISRIDRGKLKLRPTEGDVYKCLRAAAFSFNSHAAQRHMDYRVNIPDELLWAAFDRDKLEKITYNLLSNGFKFSDDGDEVSFTANYAMGELDLQVMDSGRGIPEDRLPFIFDRFYQVDSSTTKETEGSGIGLALSKELVVLMDGTITVSSETGKGSYFTVRLPIQKIKTESGGSNKSDKTKKVIAAPVSESYQFEEPDRRDLPQVLVVEDNLDMRHYLKERLVKWYRVQEAINGEDGLKKAAANVPDLIITDLMMPKMDGMEFCQKVKTDLNTSHIPVIMLTAKAGTENKIAGLETGADDYLTKPFEGEELLVRIKNLIAQRHRLWEVFAQRKTTVIPKKFVASSMDQQFLERVLALLENNFENPDFSVRDMQRELAMGNTQLHRKLKALTNEAPGELLRNFRLKKAAQLLIQKADTVTQIAYRVGFNNPSYFTKCFKHFYRVPPSSYS